MSDDLSRFDLVYCDNVNGCRVNTFERGWDGICPSCGSRGLEGETDE